MNIKRVTLLLVSFMLIVPIFLVGCTKQENKNIEFMSSAIQKYDYEASESTLNNDEELNDLWFSVGLKYKELSSVPGIDDPVIIVNGLNITRKTIEYQKALQMLPNSKPLKDEIVSIVRQKVVQSEAIKRGIKPSQESIDEYLKGEMDALKEEIPGTETILSYIKGMGITIEEYIETQEELAYSMYQRSELWLSVEDTQESHDKFVDSLVEKAEIEILDPEIKSLFSH